jgi:hypothetical protein
MTVAKEPAMFKPLPALAPTVTGVVALVWSWPSGIYVTCQIYDFTIFQVWDIDESGKHTWETTGPAAVVGT